MKRKLTPQDDKVRVVTAPAGSGKTTLLLYHFLRHLQKTPIERIVAITFTRKAAAELVGRLADLLRAVIDPSKASGEAVRLADYYRPVLPTAEQARTALRDLSAAAVCTVDSFALSLVQEFLMHAHFALSRNQRAFVDGPVEGGVETRAAWEAASRAQLEALGPAAKVVLAEMSLGEAIGEVAALARAGAPASMTAGALLDALGSALAPKVERAPAPWVEETERLGEAGRIEPAVRDAMLRWLRSRPGRAPEGLLVWLASLRGEELERARAEALQEALAALGFPWEGDLPWSEQRLAPRLAPWASSAAVGKADRVREALRTLARGARDEALTTIARAGALGYEELLEVATGLCLEPPPELASRYDVLMVDELQDTNPAQLRFYEAFAGMRGHKGIRTFFVGDVRQSIYRFRHADPSGWSSLVERADREKTRAELEVNYRSSAALVQLQREIFGRLAGGGRRGVDPLEFLQAAPGAERGMLEGLSPAAPVLVVDAPEAKDVDEHVLAEFAIRLGLRWRTHPEESAAVLVRTWAAGARAAQALRDHGLAAQLTGDRALLESRPAADLRVLLRALIDPSDDIAVAAVLKHPALGVTDRGLMLLRGSGGLGRVFVFGADLSVLEPAERARVEAGCDRLRQARTRLGREPTADVLERLLSDLHVRALLAASPEGDGGGVGLAQLEILLELARQCEAEHVDPQAVCAALTPDHDDAASDLPVVQLHHGPGTVTVTTVFAAKGLEFDHVALLELHKEGSDGIEKGRVLRLARKLDQSLLGLHLDPSGGLRRQGDPIAVLASAMGRVEAAEEGLRLFYVGFTRAAKSVTLGLRKAAKGPMAELRRVLREEALAPAVALVDPDDAKLRPVLRPVRARTGRVRAFEARWAEQQGWMLARPSSHAELGTPREEVIREFNRRAQIVQGAPAPGLPALAGLEGIPENVWGQVVHGWLERWGFEKDPSVKQAQAYLKERWGEGDPALAKWVVELGLNLRDRLPGFSDLLRQKLHFEWPLLGVEDPTIWSGRSDLVVELPGRKVVVVDFKAGTRVAAAGEIPGVGDYAPQLEAYRLMLEGAGYEVVEVGLVYVRGVSWVRVGYPEKAKSVA